MDMEGKWSLAPAYDLTYIFNIGGYLPEVTHRKKVSVSFDINGKHYSNVSVEQTYKGNYHLLADINGKERKFIIGKNKPEYSMIQSAGTSSLTDKQLKEMREKYF